MIDHDYCHGFKWEKPLLTLNQLAILAVLNSERKSLSAETIAVFLYKHFPYYNDTPLSYIAQFLKTTNGLLQRRVYEPSDYCEYYIPADKEQYCIKRFQRFYCHHRDPKSPVYSMRYPGFWDLMAKGEYREGEPLPDVILNSQPIEWPKPPIPERYLIGLAIMNSQSGRLLASEIFAFIERHFPYYKTADKKWKKQNANEALKAARGIFGREKLSTPASTDKLGNGILNVYYIKEDKVAMITSFFEKFQKEHPDPKIYGMENPDLWPAIAKGELQQNEDELRKLVYSFGKAKSQLASTDRNPYERSEESIPTEIIKPKLGILYYALLAHLHSEKKFVYPREFHTWMKDNIYYFSCTEATGWKAFLKGVLHKHFNKMMVDNEQKSNSKCMAFGLLEKTKKKLVGELLKFENKHPKICIEDYGVATREKWDRLFPPQFKKLAGSAIPAGEKKTGEEEENEEADWDMKEEEEEDEGIGQEESGFDETNEEKEEGRGEDKEEETDDRKGGRIERRDTDEMEEFVDVEDYNWFGGPSQKIEKTADKEETDNGELNATSELDAPKEVEKETGNVGGGRYQTRRIRIDFNKMLSFGDEKIPSKKAIKKGIPTSTTTKTAGVGDRKRSSDQSPEGDKKVSLLMKRSKRNVASRHEEDEDIPSANTAIPPILLIYLAMLNSDQKMCSLDEIMAFLCHYFPYYQENKETGSATAPIRSILLVSFTKRDSFDGNGNARYGYPPSTDKELRKRLDAFGSKYPRSMGHVYGLRDIGRETVLCKEDSDMWDIMERGGLREHLGAQ